MRNNLFRKLLKILKNNKKKIVSFVISFFCFSFFMLTCSLGSVGLSKDWCEGISKLMGTKVYCCEVTSSKENDNLRKIFDYADDLAGKEIKNYVDTFFISEKTIDYTPAIINFNSDLSICFETSMQYTSWQFDIHHYGFKTLSGNKIRELENDEVLISEAAARKIAQIEECSQNELIGNSYPFTIGEKTKLLKIADIIINFKDLELGPYFEENILISRYVITYNWFKNLKYVQIIRGGPLSKNYDIKHVENAIKQANLSGNDYRSNYYRLVNNKLIDDGTQSKVVATKEYFESNQNKRLILFFLAPIFSIALLSILLLFKVVNSEVLIAALTSLIIYLFILFVGFGYLIFGDVIIPLLNSPSSMILVSYIVLTICIYFLFKSPSKKVEKGDKK